MKIPNWTKPGVYGVVIGAVATLIIGFTWGGWVTGGRAQDMADTAAQKASVKMAAGLCVRKFEATPDAVAQLAKLKKLDSWNRGDFIKKGGWSTISGIGKNVSGIADACASDLASLKKLPTPVALHTVAASGSKS